MIGREAYGERFDCLTIELAEISHVSLIDPEVDLVCELKSQKHLVR